ncbi:Lanthionine synthetase C-like protein [Saccharopolyspora antimicrobica]|uniref:Lanthionine synthetase C-like protein n=1 Tax=Saccharopolyspora antimicrobica TaxID=455193 RepID=A0A1I5AUA7_9PSEU|nr:lanthionine synthetase C family protein [Saccharopolyspora antimicrobica]RKT86368.1 lanthionine synthetase-like protein [Saccharopolyspora antimicrobica]SFN66017.1 Lanthionine synthetase C-like protein [Saccharopolyspora antimicrobica]
MTADLAADTAVEFAMEIADRLARPDAADLPTDQAWWHQSLAHGAPGVALLHIELAAAGIRPFDRAHEWLTIVAGKPVTAGASTGGFYGAPAVARALAGATAVRPGTYRSALTPLARQIVADAHARVDTAHTRMDAGELPLMAEFDTIRGLAGHGAYLLHHAPGSTALRAVLSALVRLTRPVMIEGGEFPGWWTLTGPTGHVADEFPGGHGNFGLAHGICGPMALLAQALRRGIIVDGQREAVETICAWLNFWRIDTPGGHRWPYMITRDEMRSRPAHVRHSGADRRPSWCYGTAGIARALHLAALALGDNFLRQGAEDALISAVTDPAQDALVNDPSLCHGYAGLARITARAATDATSPSAIRLRALAIDLLHRARAQPVPDGPGVLEGAAGVGLAALAAVTEPATGWDTCLLIT